MANISSRGRGGAVITAVGFMVSVEEAVLSVVAQLSMLCFRVEGAIQH